MTLATSQIVIKDLTSIGVGNTTEYSVSNASSNSFFWEVTDPTNAAKLNGVLSGSTFIFKQNSDSLRTFVAFNATQAYTNMEAFGSVANQNLHASGPIDYLIITHSTLMPQAERLANLHRA